MFKICTVNNAIKIIDSDLKLVVEFAKLGRDRFNSIFNLDAMVYEKSFFSKFQKYKLVIYSCDSFESSSNIQKIEVVLIILIVKNRQKAI